MNLKFRLAIAACAIIAGGYLILSSLPNRDNAGCADSSTLLAAFSQVFDAAIVLTDGTKQLPDKWREPPTNGKAVPIDSGFACFAIPIIQSELQKYPVDVINKLLSKIVLFDDLSFFDTPYGGTADLDAIYLVVNARNTPTEHELKRLLHHELSSVFLFAKPFQLDTWMASNPNGFTYLSTRDDQLDAISKGLGESDIKSLYKAGFLSEYAKTSFEDDFNLFAEYAFAEPEKLKHLVIEYPAIHAKYEVLKTHYSSVAPGLDFSF